MTPRTLLTTIGATAIGFAIAIGSAMGFAEGSAGSPVTSSAVVQVEHAVEAEQSADGTNLAALLSAGGAPDRGRPRLRDRRLVTDRIRAARVRGGIMRQRRRPVERFPASGGTRGLATRRTVMKGGTAALVLGALRVRWPAAAGAQEAASPTADVCVLTPEMTEGPYYLPLDLVRADITEGRPGLPLHLQVRVVDFSTGACLPLPDAAVDVWHCDAQGYYSGVNANPGGGADPELGAGSASGTFLRGVQLTDADGMAAFQTIYPGWYQGRTVHIHMKVHVDGTDTEAVLSYATPSGEPQGLEGHVAHTGQIFFDDAISDEVFTTVESYAGRDNAMRLRNDQDGILGDHLDEPGFLVALSQLAGDAMTGGFLGAITIGVDAAATPEPVGGLPGGPPEGGRPPGAPAGSPPADW